MEKNEVLEQEGVAILADWRRYYPNQFGHDGLPLVNPLTPKFAAIACISVIKDVPRSPNEDYSRPCGEVTQRLVNWVCPGTASRACCISGRSVPAHPPGSDSGAPSCTHNAWGPGIPYRVPCGTPCGFGEGSYIQYRERKEPYLTSHEV